MGGVHECQPRSYGLFPMSIGPCSSLSLLPVPQVAWYASASEVALRTLFRWCYLSRAGCTSLHQYSASRWPFIESWSGVELGTVGHGPLSLSRLVVLRIARAHSLTGLFPLWSRDLAMLVPAGSPCGGSDLLGSGSSGRLVISSVTGFLGPASKWPSPCQP